MFLVYIVNRKQNPYTIELMQIFKTDNLVANRHPEAHWGIKKYTNKNHFLNELDICFVFWMQFSMNRKSIIKKSSLECHYGIICIVQMYILCVKDLQLMSILICIVNVNFCIFYWWMNEKCMYVDAEFWWGCQYYIFWHEHTVCFLVV